MHRLFGFLWRFGALLLVVAVFIVGLALLDAHVSKWSSLVGCLALLAWAAWDSSNKENKS